MILVSKVFVLIVLLSGVESSIKDKILFNDINGCKDVDTMTKELNELQLCLVNKWTPQLFPGRAVMCCSASENLCAFTRLYKKFCGESMDKDIKQLKDGTITTCSAVTKSGESVDSLYSKACPKLVNIPETNAVCKKYMPCDQSPGTGTQNSAQTLAILSISTLVILHSILYIIIH